MKRRHTFWKRDARYVRSLVIAVSLAALIVLGLVVAGVGRSSDFYLVIGASSAKGFEPSGQLGSNGKPDEGPTSNGYANDLVRLEAAKNLTLTLVNVACPGEVIQTLLHGGDACYHDPRSQLTAAIDYLRAHRNASGVVSVDAGFNNIRPCITFLANTIDCVSNNIDLIESDLPKVLRRLEKAAGRHVTFVGLEYGDPYLGYYLSGSSGQAQAAASLRVFKELNATLDNIYEKANVRVAAVPRVLRLSDSRQTATRDGQRVPENVAVACATSWMCRKSPWGPNDHPNNAGYEIIARAIERALT